MATSSDTSDQNNVKSRRPAESAFKQQRLPAWQPILTAGTVLPTFFVIGIAFIPVGIGLLYFSDEVKEHVVNYTFCTKIGSNNISCADDIKQRNVSHAICYCEMPFNLSEDFKADVYLYYGLSNYYQNHRRYVKSRDDNQLLGRLGQPLSTDCEPFAYNNETGVPKPIAPCGAIANSLFNDSLTLYSVDAQRDVPVFRTGIAWDSDKNIKFRNPEGPTLKTAFENYSKPFYWSKNIWELDLEEESNNGFQNEDLIVWMRTAALPTFRKLYRRVDHTKDHFRTALLKGSYILKINYSYPVTDFDGTKSFVISTTSLLGGKNPFLGVAYIVVGTLCLLLGIVLLVIHVRCSKRLYSSPTQSFIWDSENVVHVTSAHADRRLQNLRAINLAYSSAHAHAHAPAGPDTRADIAPAVGNKLQLKTADDRNHTMNDTAVKGESHEFTVENKNSDPNVTRTEKHHDILVETKGESNAASTEQVKSTFTREFEEDLKTSEKSWNDYAKSVLALADHASDADAAISSLQKDSKDSPVIDTREDKKEDSQKDKKE